jgi:hypothetical protein
MTISNTTISIMEGGSALSESLNAYNNIATNSINSSESHAAMLSLAGVALGLFSEAENSFVQTLSVSLGVVIPPFLTGFESRA